MRNSAELLLGFHPAVRYATRVLEREREVRCDQIAKRVCGGRDYVAALLALEQSAGWELAASSGSLVDRARRILGDAPGTATVLPAVLLMVAFAGAALIGFAQEPQPASPPAPPAPATIPAPAPPKPLRAKPAKPPKPAAPPRPVDEGIRRSEFAKQRFGGVDTQRGRTYIRFGPPDEIETESGGYERWFYRSIEGIGENVTFEFNRDKKAK